MQKYHRVDTFIRENSTHLVLFNSGSSIQDVSKIVVRYTDDVKGASMVISVKVNLLYLISLGRKMIPLQSA